MILKLMGLDALNLQINLIILPMKIRYLQKIKMFNLKTALTYLTPTYFLITINIKRISILKLSNLLNIKLFLKKPRTDSRY